MFCPNCGKEYTEEQNFCRYCGANLKTSNTELNNSQTNNEQKTVNEEFLDLQPAAEETNQNGQNKDYHIELITSSCETHSNENDSTNEEYYDKPEQENSQENQDSSKTEEHHTNFQEISENDEYRKYKRELLQNRENYLDKQVAEKRTEEFHSKQKKLSPKMITGIAILVIVMAAFGNLLWSIDVETQITPSETGEAPELNLPAEDERTYTQEPERTAQEEPPVVEENNGIYSEKAEEVPEQEKVAEDKTLEKQVIKQQEPIKEVKEVKKAPTPVEPPIPPMPKVQEPTLNFEPVGNNAN